MQNDPFTARRTGVHRLRVTTAALGAAAVVGTGGLAWYVAADTASAATTDEASSDDSGTTTGTDQFTAPSQSLGTTGSSGSHASSGGS
ncbi:hypothetical protein [Blastococcus sp. CT_GayMR16]|uniref:hypothetical protein n=1 Tax=Blastococcus sp. CT_GayMR16 TaxID=2559607 RepID=UPI0010741F97|nr:hypothetical protein [Blastococcus sp. CT_GayMR16]TFV89586.1 hypothetical protein E4P38_07445 [Blastococcus sp. CT_GayMR16]